LATVLEMITSFVSANPHYKLHSINQSIKY